MKTLQTIDDRYLVYSYLDMVWHVFDVVRLLYVLSFRTPWVMNISLEGLCKTHKPQRGKIIVTFNLTGVLMSLGCNHILCPGFIV